MLSTAEKVPLGEVQETLLIPLYCRAVETKKENPRIRDEEAVALLNKIDYDFSKWKTGKGSIFGVVARTIILDRETQNYINEHPNCVVVCIGCGLCTRYKRLDLKQATWYNVDFPDVIEARRKLITEGENVHNISKSCLDDTWPKDIEAAGKDVLIIIEGVLMYFTEDEIKHLIQIIKTNFKKVTLFAEIMHSLPSKFTKFHDTVRKTNAVFKWGIRYAKDFAKLDNSVKYIEEWDFYKGYDGALLIKMIGKFDHLKNISNKIGHYEITA